MPIAGALPYRGFACPYETLDEQFLETVAVEYARRFAKLFVERCKGELRGGGARLAGFLEAHLGQASSFETVWDNAFGQARRAVLDADARGLERRAAALGLRLLERGACGEWQLELQAPARLSWDRWLLPKTDWIRVSASAAGATIDARRGKRTQRIALSHSSEAWEADRGKPLPAIDAHGQRYLIVSGSALETWRLEGVRPVAAPGLEGAARLIRRGVDLLASHAPIFLPWVGRVLRRIVPVKSTPGMMYSGSDEDHPGTVYMSVDCEPIAIAEMLVHEATHQYYHLLARCGALDDGSAPMYFSPIKGTERPIGMILLAYHAFANVLLLYRLCRGRALRDSGYCRENERQLVPQLRELESALVKARALTPLGEALWQPLAARLR